MDDAAGIINAVAKRPRIEVKGSERDRPRDPYRVVTVVELEVPRCTLACRQNHRCYPDGAVLMVHPRQVQAHLRLYPGSYVLREVRRRVGRRAHGSGVVPKGHRDPREFLDGKRVHR